MRLLHISIMLLMLCSTTMIIGQKLEAKSGFWRLSYYQNNEQLEKERFLELLKTDSEAYSFWETSKTYETLTYPAAVLTIGFTAWHIKNESNDEFNALPAVGGIISAIAGYIFIDKITKNKSKAIQTYNQNLKSKTAFTIKPSPKGIGIVLVLN